MALPAIACVRKMEIPGDSFAAICGSTAATPIVKTAIDY